MFAVQLDRRSDLASSELLSFEAAIGLLGVGVSILGEDNKASTCRSVGEDGVQRAVVHIFYSYSSFTSNLITLIDLAQLCPGCPPDGPKIVKN